MLTKQFEIEDGKDKIKRRSIATLVTIALHALLLLFLVFYYISTPDPPFQDNEGGMTVNYGTSDIGTGDIQKFTAVPVQVEQVKEVPSTPTTSVSSKENLETQDIEDAAVVEKKTEVKKPKEKPDPNALYKPSPKPTKATTNPEETKPKVDKDALFSPGAIGKQNNSKGDGEGKGKGDQGDLNGDPNSRNYHGGGNGNGIGKGNGLGDGNVRLTGRNLRSKPTVKNPCESSRGKVVIAIKVNREGKVVKSSFTQSGSTTSDDCLVNLAQQAAMKYTFDENLTAAETQTGSIVFIFKED